MKVWVVWDDLLGRADNSDARSRNRRKWLWYMCKMLVRSSAIWEGEKIKTATNVSAKAFLPQFVFIPFQARPPFMSWETKQFGGTCRYLSLREARLRNVLWSEGSYFPFTYGKVQVPTLGWAVSMTGKHSGLLCPYIYHTLVVWVGLLFTLKKKNLFLAVTCDKESCQCSQESRYKILEQISLQY